MKSEKDSYVDKILHCVNQTIAHLNSTGTYKAVLKCVAKYGDVGEVYSTLEMWDRVNDETMMSSMQTSHAAS